MKISVPIPLLLDREQIIAVLRAGGYQVPDDAQVGINNGGEYDCRNSAVVGPDGPLRVTWMIEVDVGGPPQETSPDECT